MSAGLAKPKRDALGTFDGRWVLFAILLGAALLRLYQLQSRPLWSDELFTERYTAQGPRFAWTAGLRLESNPPLYYTVISVWRRLAGVSEFALRLPSVAASLAGIYAAYRLATVLFRDSRVSVTAAAIVALAPTNLFFAQDARGYAMQGASITFALIGAATTLQQRRIGASLLLYAAAALVAIFVHVTSVFAVTAINLAALAWYVIERRAIGNRLMVSWLLANGALVLLCLPLVPMIQSVARIAWIPPPTPSGLQSLAADLLFGPGPLPGKIWIAEAMLVLLVMAAVALYRARQWLPLLLLVLVPVVTLGGLTLVSLVKPILLTRTAFAMLTPLCILAAHGLVHHARRFLLPALVLWAGLAVDDRIHVGWSRENWRDFLASLPGLGAADTFVAIGPNTFPEGLRRYGPPMAAPLIVAAPGSPIDGLIQKIDPAERVTQTEVAAALAHGRSVWLILCNDGDIASVPRLLSGLPSPDIKVVARSDYAMAALHWQATTSPSPPGKVVLDRPAATP